LRAGIAKVRDYGAAAAMRQIYSEAEDAAFDRLFQTRRYASRLGQQHDFVQYRQALTRRHSARRGDVVQPICAK
jgi:hypothetical protein